jgi:hypothetical protein
MHSCMSVRVRAHKHTHTHTPTYAHACGPAYVLTWRYFDDLKTSDDSLPLYWSTCNFNTRDVERKAMKATHTMFVWRTRTAMEAAKNFTHYDYIKIIINGDWEESWKSFFKRWFYYLHGMLKHPSEPYSTTTKIKAVGSSKNVKTNSLHEVVSKPRRHMSRKIRWVKLLCKGFS